MPARPDLRPAPALRPQRSGWVARPGREPCLTAPNRFYALGLEGSLASATDWNRPEADKLWLYHCHYFDDLCARDAGQRTEWQYRLIARWIAENPPGQGNGWEPYPIALRIVNWVSWALAGNPLEPLWLDSLAAQSRFLAASLEWHLLANHLVADAKALVFAGTFFAGPEAERWRELGLRVLNQQMAEQVLGDGGHIERSPMYHAIVLQDLLDCCNLHRAYGLPSPPGADRIPSMGAWLAVMCHPDGGIALLNDSAFGMGPSLTELSTYARLFGFSWQSPADGMTWLAESGYARLTVGRAVLITDCAPLGPDWQPGHGHADTLTFELSLDERRLVVDPGTSCYGTGPERLRQRGTPAHNTLAVDGKDSSEVWSGFRVARRARIRDSLVTSDDNGCSASGAHDGWCRLHGVGLHRREWHLNSHGLQIRDVLEGRGQHRLRLSFLLAPGTGVKVDGQGGWILAHGERQVGCQLPKGWSQRIEDDIWGRGFNDCVPTRRIVAEIETTLPVRVVSNFRW